MQKEKYKHLTWNDRMKIERMVIEKMKKSEIARSIGCHYDTLRRELIRGRCRLLNGATYEYYWTYSAQIAQDDYERKSAAKGAPIKLGHNYKFAEEVRKYIVDQKYSPDAAIGRMRKEGKWTVCTTTLYTYIDGGYIPGVENKNLWEKAKAKRKREKTKRAKRPTRGDSIERRPKEVAERNTFGNWEMDTVIGKAKGAWQAVLVLTERLTRFEIVRKLQAKSAKAVTKKLKKICAIMPKEIFRTITVDNGTEFSDVQTLETYSKLFYCHAYHSWERGSNENQNKMIRRFYPKGQSLARVTDKDCIRIQDYMNNMPRRIFGYRTAQELFDEQKKAIGQL